MIKKVFFNAVLVAGRFYIVQMFYNLVKKFIKHMIITPKESGNLLINNPENLLEKQPSQLKSILLDSPCPQINYELKNENWQIYVDSKNPQIAQNKFPNTKKKFILGIGSQRAGSTLLANLLNQHPLVELHPLKELHYFDTLFGVRDQNVLKDFSLKMLTREIKQVVDSQEIEFISPTWKWYVESNWKLLSENIEQINYLDLYNSQLFSKNALYTGESTPEYMLLNQEQISVIKDIVGDAYVILICRNPIKRILSAFNLLIEYQAISMSNEELDELFNSMIETNDPLLVTQVAYSNYVQTIENYTNYFDNFIYLSYDDISNQPDLVLEKLTSFLGINFGNENYLDFFANRFNSYNTHYQASTKILRKLDSLFERQNEEIASLFGKPLIL